MLFVSVFVRARRRRRRRRRRKRRRGGLRRGRTTMRTRKTEED